MYLYLIFFTKPVDLIFLFILHLIPQLTIMIILLLLDNIIVKVKYQQFYEIFNKMNNLHPIYTVCTM